MAKFYGPSQWNPKYIILQIICMQTSHYIAQGLFLCIFHGSNVSLDNLFAYHTQTIADVNGMKNCFAVIVAAFFSAVCMCILIERAKKCLDFGVTLYFIDLLIQCFYSEFPKTWEWWILHIAAVALTIVLGEYLCSRRELEEIPVLDLFSKRAKL